MHSAFRREDRSLLSAMVALALSSYKFLSNLERRKRKKRESHSYNIYQKVAPDFLFANLNQHTSSSSSPKRLQKSVTVCVDLALSFEKGELAIWLTNDSPTLNLLVWKPSPLQPSTLPQQGLKPLQSNWVSATATKICTGHCFTSSCLVGCYANWPRLFTHCFLSLMCFNTTVDHDKFQ